MAPLQKRALWSFVIGLLLTIAIAVILIAQGDMTKLDTDLNLRLILYSAVIGVPLIYLVLVHITLRRPTQVDERDKLIIERASKVQWWAVVLLLVAWTIALTELYHEQKEVPLIYVNLIIEADLSNPPTELLQFRYLTLVAHENLNLDCLIEVEQDMKDIYYKYLRKHGSMDYIDQLVTPKERIYGLRLAHKAVLPPTIEAHVIRIENLLSLLGMIKNCSRV